MFDYPGHPRLGPNEVERYWARVKEIQRRHKMTIWQRLNTAPLPNAGRWAWSSVRGQQKWGRWSDIGAIERRWPLECLSPSGKMRSPRADVSVQQIIEAVFAITPKQVSTASHVLEIQATLDRVLDMPKHEIEARIAWSKLEKLAAT